VKAQGDISSKLQRSQPFILRFNGSHFIIADGSTIVVKPSTLAVTLDTLLKSFLIFNVDYPRQTRVIHHFLQHAVLDIKRDLSAKANKLFSELDGLTN
jgi:hypothetical protein